MINNYTMNDKLSETTRIINNSVRISSINTGFIDVPNKISLNIYTQGCKKRCIGCHNKELQTFNGGTIITLDDITKLLDTKVLPTWICWLGGDATYQEYGFKSFNKLFKQRNYNICLYTGQKFEDIEYMLENVDLVIDGEWLGIPVTDENTNQRVFLKQNNNWNKVNFKQLKTLL